MAQQTLNNSEAGSVIRGKINDNFTELYTNDANTVHQTGDESIDGAKTFTDPVTVSIPTGNATRSIVASFINESDVVGAGNDYENEVHVQLQAGTTANHRRYFDWIDYNGADQWLMGVNAGGNWIHYDSSSCHRFYMIPGGLTQLNSAGSAAVEINNYPGPDTLGTGGFKVYSGGADVGRALWFSIDSSTAVINKQIVQGSSQDTTQLNLTATGTGYAPASILLTATQSTGRGQGIFQYNTLSDTSWFAGVPSAVAGAKWVVGFQSAATWGADVAEATNAKFTVNSNGNVEIVGRILWGGASGSETGRLNTSGIDAYLDAFQDGGSMFHRVNIGSVLTEMMKVDGNSSANDTGVLLRADGSLKRVVLGAADSGGVGYRMLRVAN